MTAADPVPRWRDPAFVAHVRAERVAQGLPPIIEDPRIYQALEAALTTPTGEQTATRPKRTRKRSAA